MQKAQRSMRARLSPPKEYILFNYIAAVSLAARFQSGKTSHWLLALVHSMRRPVRKLKGRLG